jgi:hypothetical protein
MIAGVGVFPAPATPYKPQSSSRAILLIVTEEDGDKPYYLKYEAGFSWPGGSSGPTVGVGYDLGYEHTVEADWTGFIDAGRIGMLNRGVGLTGERAREWVNAHRHDVAITWEESLAQFTDRGLPKWEAITREHLPNTDKLPGDCFGVLVSLTYNRGPSYDMLGSRYTEMRNIRAHMAAQHFDLIPHEILAMRRLWPVGGDLWRRRGHEADLFAAGLAAGAQ